MTANPSLRLASTPAHTADAFYFERRSQQRHIVSGRVTAVRKQHHADGTCNKISSLQLLNLSDTGVGALSQEPIDCQTLISLFFPPHGAEKGFDLVGRVVRCQPRGQGYEIGVRLEARMAA